MTTAPARTAPRSTGTAEAPGRSAPPTLARRPLAERPLARRTLLALLWVAVTAYNLAKPFHIDDTAHLEIARWIMAHPLHPMSGMLNWSGVDRPIHDTNQPHLYFYLLAGWASVFGFSEIALHAFQSLFALACVVLFHRLARHFCPGAALWTTAMLILGPAFVVEQNLMVDVPLLACWLLFFDAILLRRAGRSPTTRYLLAALACSAAELVKYSSLTLLPVLVVSLVLERRWRQAWTTLVPVATLVAWSAFNVWDYGGIHVLTRQRTTGPVGQPEVVHLLTAAATWAVVVGAITPARRPRRGAGPALAASPRTGDLRTDAGRTAPARRRRRHRPGGRHLVRPSAAPPLRRQQRPPADLLPPEARPQGRADPARPPAAPRRTRRHDPDPLVRRRQRLLRAVRALRGDAARADRAAGPPAAVRQALRRPAVPRRQGLRPRAHPRPLRGPVPGGLAVRRLLPLGRPRGGEHPARDRPAVDERPLGVAVVRRAERHDAGRPHPRGPPTGGLARRRRRRLGAGGPSSTGTTSSSWVG